MAAKETHEVALTPEDDFTDPLIFSRIRQISPFSFFNPQNFKTLESCPPPVYIPLSKLNVQRDLDLKSCLRDFEITENGELKLINKDIIERQKGLFSDIARQLTSSVLEGKSIVGLSLPVRIFEPRTQMERIVDLFHFLPYFGKLAAKESKIIDKIKWIGVMLIASLPHTTSQRKPFNPILGETYQGVLDPDTQVYAEHISHHPPISRYYITNPYFKVYGSLTYNAQISPNTLLAYNEGWTTIEFNDGVKLKFSFPSAKISGVLYGDRIVKTCFPAICFEESTKLKAVINIKGLPKKSFMGSIFGSRRGDEIHGEIYHYMEDEHQNLNKMTWINMLKSQENCLDRAVTLVEFAGNIFNEIRSDSELLFDNRKDYDKAFQQNYSPCPLPSDSRFREDLIWMFYGNEKFAQKWKVKLEEQQRYERNLRMKNKNLKK